MPATPSAADPTPSLSFDKNGLKGEVSGRQGEDVKTLRMSAKVTAITDPVPADPGYAFTPDAGKKWVGVHLAVKNLDDTPLTFAPIMCVRASTKSGAKADLESFAKFGTSFGDSPIQPKATAEGDVVFEMATPDQLGQLTINCISFGTKDDRSIRITMQ